MSNIAEGDRNQLSASQRLLLALKQARIQLESVERQKTEPIAIIGMDCRFPGGANNPDAYWKLLRDGVDAMTEIPPQRWSVEAYYHPNPEIPGKMYTRYGGFIDGVDQFDPQFFGISPREAISLDPQQRLLLEVSYSALENAGHSPEALKGTQTGVFIGISFEDYSRRSVNSGDPTLIDAYSSLGNTRSIAVGRIAYVLGLQGPVMQLDTTCSSSLLAVHLACQSLRTGESNLALAGGVSLMLSPEPTIGFCKLKALALDGRCKTFDARADGYGRGEGCGIVVLKRLSDALADRDNILATILGSAVNHDGQSNGLTAPNGSAQEAVIRQALLNAKVDPAQIQYVETHGTGTSLGDPIEVLALGKVLGEGRGKDDPLNIGAVKTNFGHLEAAAGIASLIKVVLSLQHQQIPPHLHFNDPNPYIPWQKLPVVVPTKLTPWPAKEEKRLAGISSFGMSGTNVHVVLEGRRQEAEGRRQGSRGAGEQRSRGAEEQGSRGAIERPLHLLTLSAKSEKALQELAQRYETFLAFDAEISLADVCFTANTGRSHFDHRLTVIAETVTQLREKLKALVKEEETLGLLKGQVSSKKCPKIAFLFTGQGSQYVDMGRQLYETQPIFRATLDQCAEILQPYLDKPLLEVLYPHLGNRGTGEQRSRGAEEQRSREQENKETRRQKSVQPSTFNLQPATFFLDKTAYTQPALFALEYALYQLWQSWGIKPDVVIGHSVGEYVAACVAGVFSLEDGLKLIAQRGRLMQELPQDGAMVAVFASEDKVQSAIQSYHQEIAIAAINGSQSIVISGKQEAIEFVIANLEAEGIKTTQLNVSHAFHSPLMEPMLAKFKTVAQQFHYSLPKLKIISNLTGTIATNEIATPQYWCRHLRQPVRFAQGMTTLAQQGCEICLEIGPKPTLLGMGRSVLEVGSQKSEVGSRKDKTQPLTFNLQLSTPISTFNLQPQLWLPSLRPGYSDWQQMLESLADLYVKGVKVDWLGFDRDSPRRRLPLPTYPFQRQRYWLENVLRRTFHSSVIRSQSQHPLLGQKLNLAGSTTLHFESQISQDLPAFLGDHRVFETAILPAAGFLEMVLAAGAVVFPNHEFSIEAVSILQALVLPPEVIKTTQLNLIPETTKGYRFEIYSLKPSKEDQESIWTLHTSGKIVSQEDIPIPTVVDIEAQRATFTEEITAQTYYQKCRERGIDYGKSFQAIKYFWKQEEKAIAQINLPEAFIAATSNYQLHPVLLDACLQVAGATLSEENQQHTYLPVGLERFTFYPHCDFRRGGFPNPPLQTYAQIRPVKGENSQTFTADLQLIASDGQLIATIEGLQLKSANPQTLLGTQPDSLQDWLYEVEWRSQKLPEETLPPDYLLTPKAISDRLIPQLTQLTAQPELEAYRELLSHLEAVSVTYILQAFTQLGWEWELRARFPTAQLVQQLGIINSYHRLCDRLLEILAEEGILRKLDGQWEVRRQRSRGAEGQRSRGAEGQEAEGRSGNFASAEVTLLERCGSQLAQVLKGECDPIQLLFPEGDLTTASQLYQDSPGAKLMNTLVQQAILTALKKKPPERKVRILEIGAGTGGTTSSLLPYLDAAQTEYLFTDISPLFTTKAQQKFRDYPFVDYRLLNIEQDPQSQGFRLQHYDLIVAANVLHATQDLRQTIAHIRQLLAPQGMLILLEGTRPLRWLDLIFGLTEGWWRFTDYQLRPFYPLLSASQWQKLLRESGFEEAVAVSPDLDSQGLLGQQAVIIAQNERINYEKPKNWLIFADHQGIGEQLAKHLRNSGENCTLVFAAQNYQQLTEQDYQVNPSNAADFQQLLKGNQFHRIIHLWSLEVPEAQDLSPEALATAAKISCGSTLYLIQSLLEEFSQSHLWLVTKGAVSTGEESNIPGIAQSPLWGLGKAIALEHPELNCVCIDLDPVAQLEAQGQTLLSEIQSNATEDRVAFRHHNRYVARLVRHTQEVGRGGFPNPPVRESGGAGFQTRPYGSRKSEFSKPYQLTISQRGTLENLQWQPITRRPPETGEVEIRIRATGLNFRDVLNALDLYLGNPGPLGCECVGEIVALGKGVKDLAIGQAVVAIASGSFSQYVTVNGAMVAQKPEFLSFEESATIPVAFLTAYYTLHHLAKIKKGDCVLIHAATGGVGQAAIQIAQQAGAKVFATASLRKWDALKSLGVRHILNSRTLDFAEEVSAMTQGRGVDIVLNSLSGESIVKSLSVLKNQGRFIEIGKSGVLDAKQVAQLKPEAAYFLVDMVELCQKEPALVQSMLHHLMQQFQEGKLQPLPHQVFPLQDVVSAFRTMQQAKHIGKIVISQEAEGRRQEAGGKGQKIEVRPDGTYLITGGLGGLGLLVARQMVKWGARNLVLVGRSGVNSTAQEQLTELEQLGARIIVAQADVSQKEQLARVLREIEQALPPLRGVIHAAGVLDDGVVRQLSWQRLEKVIAPKVKGAWNLHLLTQDKPLDFFILFSSAASLLGSLGQGNHMAANTFLDTLAHYRHCVGLPGLSINWGAWSDIGAAAKRQVDEQMRIKGVGAIAPAQGLQLLEQLMQQSSAQVGVVPINGSRFFVADPISPFFEDFSPRSEGQPEEQPEFLQQLQATPPEERRACLAAHIRVQIAKVLGFSPSEVDLQKGFFDLGMDSLTSIELKNRLQNSLGCSLSSTVAFDYPTVEALVNYLAQEVLNLGVDAEVKEELAGETDSLAELSQDDIADLLAQELLTIEQGKKL